MPVRGKLILEEELPETLDEQELIEWKEEWMPKRATLEDARNMVVRLRGNFKAENEQRDICDTSVQL